MKFKIFRALALVSLFVFISCETEPFIDNSAVEKIDNLKNRPSKVDVCHYDQSEDTWKVLNISINALNAHLRHGDVQLIDSDGDGYTEQINECVPGGDCNDMDAEINPGMIEICGNGIDDNCDGQIDEECGEGIAYSLRKFFGWSNAVLKIRRSSDNATAYLFFDGASSSDLITTSSYISTTSNTTPDTTTFGTWISTNDGFVEEWIAQTPKDIIDNDLITIQTTTSEQPKIVSAGVIVTDNSLPALDFDGTDQLLSTSGKFIPGLDPGENFTVLTVSSSDINIGSVFCNSDSSNFRFVIFNDKRVNKRNGFIQTASGTFAADNIAQHNTADVKLLSNIVDDAYLIESYHNGTVQTNDTYSGSFNNDRIRIGVQHGGNTKINGRIQEIWIFLSDESSNMTTHHSDINTYYSIY